MAFEPNQDKSSQDRAPSTPPSILRRVLSLPAIISMVFAALFLVFIVTRFGIDLSSTWDRVAGSNPWYLALAFVVHYTTFFFRGARWRLLLQNTSTPGTEVPGVLYCSQLVLLGWFANSVGWLRLGDAYRAYLYRDEQGGSFSRTIGTILAERAMDAVLVALLMLASVPFLLDRGNSVTWVVLGLAISFVVGLAVMLVAMTWARGLLVRRMPPWLAVRYDRFHEGTMGSFQRLPMATLCRCVSLSICVCLSLYMCMSLSVCVSQCGCLSFSLCVCLSHCVSASVLWVSFIVSVCFSQYVCLSLYVLSMSF